MSPNANRLASSSESLAEDFNDDIVQVSSQAEPSIQERKSPKSNDLNSDHFVHSNNLNLIRSNDVNTVITVYDNVTSSTGPTAKPRSKTRNSTEAFAVTPPPISVNTPDDHLALKSPTGINRPKPANDPVIKIATEEDTSECPSHRASPGKKYQDTLDVQGNDDDAYSSGGVSFSLKS
ncbi:unnamed protein product [Trichobilharzia regenti]|nr:unnamed protein product [Trichobilharzia regenti]